MIIIIEPGNDGLRVEVLDGQVFQKSTNFESFSSQSRDGTTASKGPQKKNTKGRDEETSSPQLSARDRGQPSEEEKPWGRTLMPRKLLHSSAILVRGYPFKAEVSNSK